MKIFTGVVISTKMPKTATVKVERIIAHPIYKKRMKRSRLFHVHDEMSSVKVGDLVKFAASKPHSKSKKWELVEERKVTKKSL